MATMNRTHLSTATPKRPSRPRRAATWMLAFIRHHQATTAILFVLAVMTTVTISLIRDDPLVVAQGEMAQLATAVQEFGHMPYRVRLNGAMANSKGMVPSSLNRGNHSLLQPLIHHWGGQVRIEGVARRAAFYDIVYAELPEEPCHRLAEWASQVPLFEQVILNGVPVYDPNGHGGTAVPYDAPLTQLRCSGRNVKNTLALRVRVPLRNREPYQHDRRSDDV